MRHECGHRPARGGRSPSRILLFDLVLLPVMVSASVLTYLGTGLRVVPAVVDRQVEFWTARASELCHGRFTPAMPWRAARADAVQSLVFLHELTSYAGALWSTYQRCQEPRTVIIDEELLQFVVDSAERFEHDPAPAFDKIRGHVDRNLGTHSHIYVLGHTDDTFTERHNLLLSYRRALTVAAVIDEHLEARGVRGGTYTIYPVGMGKSQLLVRRPVEDTSEWRKRCRRIELSFRSPAVHRPAEDGGR